MREGALSLRTAGGEIHNFNVNATIIAAENSKTIGAIVTLRDMTDVKRNKEDLDKAAQELKVMQIEVSRQNRELTYLANHDSLTGCLNRRSFFGRFQLDMEQAPDLGTNISVLMMYFDQYARVNNELGPVESDMLIIGVANIVRSVCGETHYVSRRRWREILCCTGWTK